MKLDQRSLATAMTVVVGLVGLATCGGDTINSTERAATRFQADADGFNGTLIVPALSPADVPLTDTHGAQFNIARSTRDGVTAIFFGFTNCKDVCPTTMADLAAGRRAIPSALAARVKVVFITVDPARDTPAVLQEWLGRYDRDFIGLSGSTEQVNQLERSLYLPESSVALTPPEPQHSSSHQHSAPDGTDYEVDHSGMVYLFGPGNKMVLHSGGTTPPQYAEDFTGLLQT